MEGKEIMYYYTRCIITIQQIDQQINQAITLCSVDSFRRIFPMRKREMLYIHFFLHYADYTDKTNEELKLLLINKNNN